jgi:VIT1/CCC1 family predicted Fe2+/Mn2+ transporter
LVIIGGLAELFSGAISMGLGAFLAANTERQKYNTGKLKEYDEVERFLAKEKQEY